MGIGDFSSGVTLVELMIAMAISVMIMAAIATTYSALVTSSQTVSRATEEGRLAQSLLDRLRRELTSIVRTASDSTAIRGRDELNRDELTIMTLAYGPPRQIRYFWQDGELRRMERDPAFRDEPLSVPLRGIARFNCEFLAMKGQWRNGWNEPALPLAVRLELGTAERQDSDLVAL